MSIHALTVADCMVPPRLTVKPNMSIKEAVEKMIHHHLIGAPVVDDNMKVVGFLSEQDCLAHMISDSYYHEQNTLVNEVMQNDVLFASPDMAVFDLAQLMCENKPKKFPVCENGKLIGIITRTHILKALLSK
ncbi:CBS domain-containing protein [Reinekea marinisedimentorum]|uniref:CBS domain protein n=1 Tax=Reinekea marinisedimentorum TaxID=230495 RepID=A0A4R3I8N3_9GAMM|nr:CBS domain-containing protein [Reinekea marinisedimentorum]TCS41366.1 CBS domain protein [Reinekea marinisedimentorum]